MAAQQAEGGEQQDAGLYCSTAGTYFQSKQDLDDHYRSDFHRYNLKRKIAGLPPVTRDWYDVRKAQLLASSAGPVHRVWFDPLTKRKFYSKNTYLTFARSKKYQDLVKKSGEAAPAPIVTLRKVESAAAAAPAAAAPAPAPTQPQQQIKGDGYTIKPVVRSGAAAAEGQEEGDGEAGEEDAADEGSDWETASEEEMETDQKWDEWDVRRSLFDGHLSASLEANLEYMFKNFGFYFPDSQCLSDPEGLLKYLGAKLQYGHVPLYESGDNPKAKQFHSLHAVQRHMVDTNQCKMAWEENEREYDDYYDWGEDGEDGEEGGDADMAQAGALVVSTAEAGPSAAFELVLAGSGNGSGGGGGKIIGSREFARYYRQRPRLGDSRASVQAGLVQAQYRRLAVPLLEGPGPSETLAQKKMEKQAKHKAERLRFKMDLSYDKIHNLPKNVPY